MLLLKSYNNVRCTNCFFLQNIKAVNIFSTSSTLTFSTKSDPLKVENKKNDESSSEKKFLFNSVLYEKDNKLGYFQKRKIFLKQNKIKGSIEPLPLSLKFVLDNTIPKKKEVSTNNLNENPRIVQFPFRSSNNIDEVSCSAENNEVQLDTPDNIDKQIRFRHKELRNWMNAYDNLVADENSENSEINYGTPDPKSTISNVPCGGCGAFLHCKDTALPGYIPSEIFHNAYKPGAATLEAIICQRCFFLKEHDVALQVRVSAKDYPKVLMSLQDKKALMLLMVDLTDFPCSIWPGIADILGPKTPVFVIGNKIDLIPKDSDKFIPIIKQKLLDHVKICGFGTSNILEVALISAKTGYGIEDLISSLHNLWKVKGDVYLIGCTNVGKSSLYNALLGSDYCKIQATDLIQRATTSQWPGTTLNLLKFPIMKPSAHRLYLRNMRLIEMNRQTFLQEEKRIEQLRANNVAANATLIGRIEHTFTKHAKEKEKIDGFSMAANSQSLGKTTMGINENHPDYASGRWCYDTPGVVHPDQILDLLTLDELILTLPKELIRPETFCVKPGMSLFIAGLARFDYIDGPKSVRLTVFRSNELPITICYTDSADETYKDCLGTDLFKVPRREGNRLKNWPGLEKAEPFRLVGTDRRLSSHDIVLSNAGWIAITCGTKDAYTFQAWTPKRRGIHLRDCILPRAVLLKGRRIKYSVAYEKHTFI